MSMATLEKAILFGAKEVFKNSKLRKKDLLEWSSGELKPQADTEVVARVPDPGVWVCVLKTMDKRKEAK